MLDLGALDVIPEEPALLEGTGKHRRAFEAVMQGVGDALGLDCVACNASRALPDVALKSLF